MYATAAVADQAAGLRIPRGSGLAGVAIPTPRTIPGQLALEENVEGCVPRVKRCCQQPELLLHGECLEVALH
jgi:hypothetical protein